MPRLLAKLLETVPAEEAVAVHGVRSAKLRRALGGLRCDHLSRRVDYRSASLLYRLRLARHWRRA